MEHVKLVAIGGGIHAVFYKRGVNIGERDLGHEVEVDQATEEDLADRPANVSNAIRHSNPPCLLTFCGFFVVPGSGLAAIYGAMPPGGDSLPEDMSDD